MEGRRRRVLQLRAMSSADVELADVVAAGGRARPRPDVPRAALPRGARVDPRARLHGRYEVVGEGGGAWNVEVRDGERLGVTCGSRDERRATAIVRVSRDAYERMATEGTQPDGRDAAAAHPDRGRDPPRHAARPLDRPRGRPRRPGAEPRAAPAGGAVVARGLWGANAAGARRATRRTGRGTGRTRRELLDYRQLYALWERQNWRSHELDFSVDREHWLATPSAAQQNTVGPRVVLRGGGAGHGRPGPVPARGTERRDRALPRHAARGRGPPRRLLRPLRRRGDGADRGRSSRPHARGREDAHLAMARGVRRRAA